MTIDDIYKVSPRVMTMDNVKRNVSELLNEEFLLRKVIPNGDEVFYRKTKLQRAREANEKDKGQR